MAEVVATAILPGAGMKAFEFVQGIIELSKRLKANHLRLEAKMKTVRGQRDDIMNKYTSTDDRTIDDWFSKVKDAESLAQELERRFRKKQKKLTMIYVRFRSMLSKEMASMCLDIDDLIRDGHILRTGEILQGALGEIHEHLKAIRAPGNLQVIGAPRNYLKKKLTMIHSTQPRNSLCIESSRSGSSLKGNYIHFITLFRQAGDSLSI